MTKQPFFVCPECGGTALAVSHTWTERTRFEQVGFVDEGGRYLFEPRSVVEQAEEEHEWIAYCGGCGAGVTVEWLPEGRLRLLLAE